VGDLFEWEPATGKAQARIFALGRQVAAKTIGTATLRTGLGIHGIPLERIIPFVMGAVCWVVGAVILLILLVHGGLASGLQLRPAYGTVALCLIALVALPPQAWAGFASPPGQGTYRRWIWQDPLGTSVYITDEGGLAIHARAFDPFGGVAVERTTEPTERTFAGHPFESGSGLYYMKARWYDPITGRFQSVDPVVRDMSVPQSMNGYSYVENNPVNMIDPTGMEGTNDLKGLTGGGPDKFGETSTCFATCSVVFSLNTGRAPSPNAGGADPNVLFGKIMILSKPLGETGAGPRVAQPVQERSYVLITDTVTLRPGEAAVLQPRPTGEKAILRVDGIDDRIFTGLLVDKFGEQPLYLSLQPRFEFAFEGRAVLDLDYENPLFITDGLGTVGSEIPAPNFANFIFEPGVPGAEFKFQYILINKGNASLRFTTTIISTNVY
jgi:RHS repeat-associated protein